MIYKSAVQGVQNIKCLIFKYHFLHLESNNLVTMSLSVLILSGFLMVLQNMSVYFKKTKYSLNVCVSSKELHVVALHQNYVIACKANADV